MKKLYLILLVIFFSYIVLLSGYTILKQQPSVKSATLENLKPSIMFENREYLINMNTIVDKKNIGKQVAKVTRVTILISYSENNDPYKILGKICIVNGELPENKLAIEIGNSFYIAEVIKK